VLSFAPHKRLLWPAGIYFVKDASAGDAADATRDAPGKWNDFTHPTCIWRLRRE